jgi:hypothetical protein
VSRLPKLFRRSPRPVTRKARLGVEALDGRLVPSATFVENSSSHTLTVTAGQHQNNTITIRNDGDGNLRIVTGGVTRNFTHVQSLVVNTGDGKDTVTYSQGTSTHSVDLHRNFSLRVDLGSQFDGNDADHFTANVFGNLGFVQDGVRHARDMSFQINGGADRDVIAMNFNDTDLIRGSVLTVNVDGSSGDDDIRVYYAGQDDATSQLRVGVHGGGILAGFDHDTIGISVFLQDGSAGVVAGDGPGGSAVVTGDLGDDRLYFAVFQEPGSHADVNALIDGGFNLGDADIGRHTANVRTSNVEQDFVVS